MDFYEVVVIGAGPAGSVASAYLHKQGKSVLLLEKETFPRFVIGESLLPSCMQHLEEAGLLEAIKKADFQIKTGAIFYKGDAMCSFEFKDQYSEGWNWTWQVKRAEFDKILIDEAQNKGVDVLFNCTVTDVVCNTKKQIVTYKNSSSEITAVETKFVIDASGYGRVLPNLFDLNIPSSLTARGAIFTHVNDINRSDKAGSNIFVHSFNKNTAWLWAIPFSDGTTSVGVVGENKFIKQLTQNDELEFKKLISSFPGLKGRFNNAELLFNPKNILGYSVGVKQMFGEGYVLCGNSTEFLDPVFSSGVTLATGSGLLAAKLVNAHIDNELVDWGLEYEKVLTHGIDVFRSYVNAWYSGDLQEILFSDNIQPEFKQQICSVLAGYVWDTTNPFVRKHKTILPTLAKVIKLKQ